MIRTRTTVSVLAALIVTLTACERVERLEPSPADLYTVNLQPYSFNDLAPVDVAYRIVAQHRGWTPATIDLWQAFIVGDVIRKESGGCWNLRRGAVLANGGAGCQLARQGRHTDSGFGQVVPRSSPWLCEAEGLCGSDAIVADAWSSMTATLALIERSGRFPWCWSAYARRFHPGCNTAPRVWVNE